MDQRDELVGFGGDQGEGLEAASVRPLPRVPDVGEGKGSRFNNGDCEDALDGLRSLLLPGWLGRRAKEITGTCLLYRGLGFTPTGEIGTGPKGTSSGGSDLV